MTTSNKAAINSIASEKDELFAFKRALRDHRGQPPRLKGKLSIRTPRA